MDAPIFILGCTKSGTTLMRNLFDGHPDLFVVPMESHFFEHSKKWVSYYARKTKPQDISFDEIKANMLNWIRFSNEVTQTVTDAFTEGKWNVELFKESLFSQDVNSQKDLFDLYVRSIYKSLHEKDINPEVNFVEKSVENAEFAIELQKIYPKARFIHILRNPYSNIVAFRKYVSPKKFPYLKTVLFSMYNSYYYLLKNIDLIDNYFIIKYEDLISNPEGVMNELANSLNIKFDSKLLSPSLLGEFWGGNSTSKEKFKGVSNKNIDKWKKEITSFEINIINELFENILDKFEIEKIKAPKNIYYPAKKENIKNYFFNRSLWFNFSRF